MTTSAKIRLLLALLFASLLLTALIVQNTYTPKNNLFQTAETLENNLHKKEGFINSVINDKARFAQLKTLAEDEQAALRTIKTFTTDESIWLTTFKKNKLSFWSGVRVITQRPASIREGYSFVREPNGFYEVIKKSEGDFSAIFFIPVKISYPVQNKYLHNIFARNLLNDNNIEIADFTDAHVYPVHSLNGTLLFSVKVKQNEVGHKFFYFQVVIWILCAMVLSLLVHSICNYIALKGYAYLSFILLAAFIVLLRFINLHYSWPGFTHQPDIFDPQIYRYSVLFPSLGDLCINILCICWFVAFIYRHRDRLLRKQIHNRIAGYIMVIGLILILILSSSSLLKLFYGLVINSKINFDVNNVLNLSGFSMLGVLMLCFSFLIFYLLTEISLTVCSKLSVPVSHQTALLVIAIITTTIIKSYNNDEFTVFYILLDLWVLIRGHA